MKMTNHLAVSESFILAVIGAIASLITIVFSSIRQSRCSELSCLCFKCSRTILTTEEMEMEATTTRRSSV